MTVVKESELEMSFKAFLFLVLWRSLRRNNKS